SPAQNAIVLTRSRSPANSATNAYLTPSDWARFLTRWRRNSRPALSAVASTTARKASSAFHFATGEVDVSTASCACAIDRLGPFERGGSLDPRAIWRQASRPSRPRRRHRRGAATCDGAGSRLLVSAARGGDRAFAHEQGAQRLPRAMQPHLRR